MFSVIVPLYNKRPYIRRCVDSILSQSFLDFELIVVDDGSTDASHEVLENITDSRFKIIRQKNKGEGFARNAGMSIALGKWFAFIDADDMWLPNHLEELCRIINLVPSAGMVSTSSVKLIDGAGYSLEKIKDDLIIINEIDYFFEASRNIGIINSSSTAIRSDIFKKMGGFGKYKAGADLEYWARIALYYSVALSTRITIIYFRNTGGVMEQIEKKKKRSVDKLHDLSPSVGMLCDATTAKIKMNEKQKRSIRLYINSRVFNSIRGALYQGDIKRAQKYRKFYLSPVPLIGGAINLLLLLPPILINAMLFIYGRVRAVRYFNFDKRNSSATY